MRQLELWSASDGTTGASESAEGVVERVAVARTCRALPSPVESVDVLAPEKRTNLDELALEYLRSARAERTLAAYSTNWRLFERWCLRQGEPALPASTATLMRYLVYLAQSGRKPSTIRRARIAIGVLHGQRGLPRPDQDDRVRMLERGIGRRHGTREQGATPLQVPELERMVSALGRSVRADRDRALLLLGFAGAFRSSELVALDMADVELRDDAARVLVRRSKEDPCGKGAITQVPRASSAALCPVLALERWVARLDDAGPLFRVVHGSRVSGERLVPRAVSRAVQRAAARADLPGDYSSHSLRSGLATSAHAQGCSTQDIQAHGRWKDLRSLDRYIDVSAEVASRVVAGLL